MKNIDIIRRRVIVNGIIFRSTYLPNYYVSSDGTMIVQIYYDTDNRTIKKLFLMKQETLLNGYKRVQGPNHTGHHLVHKLVYSAWGNEILSPYLVIDHIDANPSNNNISNLRQVTQQHNIENAIIHGNFGKNATKKIRVYDSVTNTYKNYSSVKEFLLDIGAPEYMVKHNSLSGIRKRSEYNRYQYAVIQES